MIKKEKMEVAVDIGSKCGWNHISFLVKKKTMPLPIYYSEESFFFNTRTINI